MTNIKLIKNHLEKELPFFSPKNFFTKISKTFEDPQYLLPLQQNNICPICLDTMENNVTYLFCQGREITEKNPYGNINGHIAHTKCLEQWFTRNRSCPCCRHSFEDEIGMLDHFPVSYIINLLRNKIGFGTRQDMRDYVKANADKILIMGGMPILKIIIDNFGSPFSIDNLTNHFQPEELINFFVPRLNHYNLITQLFTIKILTHFGSEYASLFGRLNGIEYCMQSILLSLPDIESEDHLSRLIIKRQLYLMKLMCFDSEENIKRFSLLDGAQFLCNCLSDVKSKEILLCIVLFCKGLIKDRSFKKLFKKTGGLDILISLSSNN